MVVSDWNIISSPNAFLYDVCTKYCDIERDQENVSQKRMLILFCKAIMSGTNNTVLKEKSLLALNRHNDEQ